MDIVKELFERVVGKTKDPSILIVFAGDVGLGCLNETRTATALSLHYSREFIGLYNEAISQKKTYDIPDLETLWKLTRPYVEQQCIRCDEGAADFQVPPVLAELDSTSKGIRFEHDYHHQRSEVGREGITVSILQNIDCMDYEENDHS